MKCQQQSTPHPTPPHSIAINHFNIPRNILLLWSPNICCSSFKVSLSAFIYLSFLSISVTLSHHTPYLPSPLPVFIYIFFFMSLSQTRFPSLFVPHFPLQPFPQFCRLEALPLDLAAPSLFPWPLWSLCRPSFSGSVWCVSL